MSPVVAPPTKHLSVGPHATSVECTSGDRTELTLGRRAFALLVRAPTNRPLVLAHTARVRVPACADRSEGTFRRCSLAVAVIPPTINRSVCSYAAGMHVANTDGLERALRCSCLAAWSINSAPPARYCSVETNPAHMAIASTDGFEGATRRCRYGRRPAVVVSS